MSICMISITYKSILSLVERSAASWSALGTWKCSCFGNRGDLGVFWDVMVSLVSSQDLEVNQRYWCCPFAPKKNTGCSTPRKLAWHFFQSESGPIHHFSVLFIVFWGGVVMFVGFFDMCCLSNRFIRICQAEVHIGLGPSQVQSGKCLGKCAYKFVGKTRKKAIICCTRELVKLVKIKI